MAGVAIIRQIYFLPGREAEGVRWLSATEATRILAGQVAQYLLQGQIDTKEYLWVQIWADTGAYEAWHRSEARERLASERGRFLTHHPTRTFDLVD